MSVIQLTKQQVFYRKKAPPSIVWVYECRTCPLYEGKDKRTCKIVKGDIAPNAWCIFWIPKPFDLPFSWLFKEKKKGDR